MTRPQLDTAGAIKRSFQFQRNVPGGPWVINGEPFDPERMDARPRLDSTEIWTLDMGFGGLKNRSGVAHPVHLHLVQFRVLDRNGKKPFTADATSTTATTSSMRTCA